MVYITIRERCSILFPIAQTASESSTALLVFQTLALPLSLELLQRSGQERPQVLPPQHHLTLPVPRAAAQQCCCPWGLRWAGLPHLLQVCPHWRPPLQLPVALLVCLLHPQPPAT